MIALQTLGIIMAYLIVFSDIMGSLVTDLFGFTARDPGFTKVLASREFWVIFIALVTLPICLKKELQEMHLVSVGLFFATLLFTVIELV